MLECDASEEAAVAAAFEQVDATFGQVDILVNLAYTPLFAPPEELTLDTWERAFSINVTSYFLTCREAGRRMIEQGRGGAIMNMCSIAGTSGTRARFLPLQHGQGRDRDDDQGTGDRVGQARDPRQCDPALPVPDARSAVRLEDPALGHIRDKFLSGIPLNRLGEPDEMVGPVVFLVSDAAAMVTGVLLPVDGGNLALNAGGTKD